jgi:phage terminase large subunit
MKTKRSSNKKSYKKDQLTLNQGKSLESLLKDPVLFATRTLGANLWAREVEILRSIQLHRHTAIKACHGVGKTFTLAHAVLWWLVRYEDGIVLTTAPTLRQVETQLWSEIHRVAARAKFSFPEINTTGFKLRGEDNFALGLSTNRSDNFQGYHGKHLLIIADEAPGLESRIWDAIAGTMAGGKVHVVMAGNPILPAGAFFDAFGRGRDLWNCITVDAFDSPNLAGISLEQLLQMDPSAGGPLDQNPVSYLVTRRWVYDQHKAWWHGDERSSPNWMSRVRGQFPDQAQNALIKLAWLERALERASLNPVADDAPSLIAGVDVGGGQAETVVYLCASKPGQHQIINMGAWRGEDTRGEVVRFLAPYRSRLTTVRVDDIGIGHNFGLHLRDERFVVELVNVSLPCESRPGSYENDPVKRFANRKAQFYQTLADAFEHDQIDGLTDDQTISQLADIMYEIDSHGRMKIEPKEKARQRGVRSPDRAEALMLALGKPRSMGEIIMVSTNPSRAKSHSVKHYERAPYETGFVLSADQSDENDRPSNLRRVERRSRFRSGGW